MKTKIKNICYSLSLILVLSVLIMPLSCGQDSQKQSNPNTDQNEDARKELIKIGAILPLTGPISYLGEEEKNALLLLQEDLSKQGKDVEFLIEDSQTDVKTGISAYQKLKLEEVTSFIVSSTFITEGILPISEKNKDVVFSLSVHPEITKDRKYTYRVYYGLEDQIPLWYELLKQREATSVSALYARDVTVDVTLDLFRQFLEDKSIAFLGTESYEFSDNDIRPQFEKIRQLNSDLIICEDWGTKYSFILREAAKYGIKENIVGGIGMLLVAGADSTVIEGVPFIGPRFAIESTSSYKEFLVRYQNKYERGISFDGAFTYMSGLILYEAMEASQSNDRPLSENLIGNNFSFFGEEVIIDSTGTASFGVTIGQYLNNEVVPYELN